MFFVLYVVAHELDGCDCYGCCCTHSDHCLFGSLSRLRSNELGTAPLGLVTAKDTRNSATQHYCRQKIL